MWPDLPIEFFVVGTPPSVNATSKHARAAKTLWKDAIKASARAILPEGAWAFDEAPKLAVTLFYFPQAKMVGDVDNIVKTTIDGMIACIFVDDEIVDRVVVQRFDPASVFSFVDPSNTLLEAVALEDSVLYIRVSEAALEGIRYD